MKQDMKESRASNPSNMGHVAGYALTCPRGRYAGDTRCHVRTAHGGIARAKVYKVEHINTQSLAVSQEGREGALPQRTIPCPSNLPPFAAPMLSDGPHWRRSVEASARGYSSGPSPINSTLPTHSLVEHAGVVNEIGARASSAAPVT